MNLTIFANTILNNEFDCFRNEYSIIRYNNSTKRRVVICFISQIRDGYGPNLDRLSVGQTVGVLVDSDSSLHLYVDNVDQGVAVKDLPRILFATVDLYGQCERVSVVGGGETLDENEGGREKDCLNRSQPLQLQRQLEQELERQKPEHKEKADLENGTRCVFVLK